MRIDYYLTIYVTNYLSAEESEQFRNVLYEKPVRGIPPREGEAVIDPGLDREKRVATVRHIVGMSGSTPYVYLDGMLWKHADFEAMRKAGWEPVIKSQEEVSVDAET
jgi:hypothetical protein